MKPPLDYATAFLCSSFMAVGYVDLIPGLPNPAKLVVCLSFGVLVTCLLACKRKAARRNP